MKRKWFRTFAKLIVISRAILSTFYISKASITRLFIINLLQLRLWG